MDNIKTSRNNNAECPICHSKLENSVCTSCGWVHMVFPEQVPQAIATFNAKRSEVARKIHNEISINVDKVEKLKKENENAVANSKSLKEIADRAQEDVRDAKSEVQRITSQNKSLKREIEAVQAELDSIKRNPPVPAGTQIRIVENNGKYTLYDASGIVHRANGNAIGKGGIELYDGYVFRIGELFFTVNAPEVDFDNLII